MGTETQLMNLRSIHVNQRTPRDSRRRARLNHGLRVSHRSNGENDKIAACHQSGTHSTLGMSEVSFERYHTVGLHKDDQLSETTILSEEARDLHLQYATHAFRRICPFYFL